jgi:hypothetical protein
MFPEPLTFAANTENGFLAEFQSLPVGESRVLALVDYVDQNRQSHSDQTCALLKQEVQHCHEQGWEATAARCEYILAWLALDRADYAEAYRLFERVERTMRHCGD